MIPRPNNKQEFFLLFYFIILGVLLVHIFITRRIMLNLLSFSNVFLTVFTPYFNICPINSSLLHKTCKHIFGRDIFYENFTYCTRIIDFLWCIWRSRLKRFCKSSPRLSQSSLEQAYGTQTGRIEKWQGNYLEQTI